MYKRGVLWILILVASVGVTSAGDSWPQWGGPDRDFQVKARKLSQDWGEDGPARIWERPLGGGFASIVADGRRLYTAYRNGDEEVIVAFDRKSGETTWEYRYDAPVPKSPALSTEYGEGPNATPLLTKGKLVSLGFTGQVHCLDAAKGTLLWSHDLGEEFEVKIPYFGHAASPLAVGKRTVIVAGGVWAFDLDTGSVAWKNTEFQGSYGSPRLVRVDDLDQIVTPVSGRLAAYNPGTGATLWSEELKNQWGTILTSPVVDEQGNVFISAAQVGSVLVDPTGGVEADKRQIWKDESTQIAHSNAVRAGELVFASVGEATSFMTATSLESGEQVWKARGFGQANLVRVGDEYLLLDFEGQLALVDLGSEGMKVVTRASINDKPTWTPPTLLGTTLYVRDENRIQALDLKAPESK